MQRIEIRVRAEAVLPEAIAYDDGEGSARGELVVRKCPPKRGRHLEDVKEIFRNGVNVRKLRLRAAKHRRRLLLVACERLEAVQALTPVAQVRAGNVDPRRS